MEIFIKTRIAVLFQMSNEKNNNCRSSHQGAITEKCYAEYKPSEIKYKLM
jgi:hypothetical protein